jgi:hypothetical protein
MARRASTGCDLHEASDRDACCFYHPIVQDTPVTRASKHTDPKNRQRRQLLATGGLAVASTLVSTRGADASQSAPPTGNPVPGIEFVYEAIVLLEASTPVGETPFGRRNRIPIIGGEFAGPDIKGKVLPGGMDWQLIRPDRFTVIEADYMMQTDDGALIHVYNKGVVGMASGGEFYARSAPWFEAPNGPHVWLNQAVFVGTLGPVPERPEPAVRIRVFKVT